MDSAHNGGHNNDNTSRFITNVHDFGIMRIKILLVCLSVCLSVCPPAVSNFVSSQEYGPNTVVINHLLSCLSQQQPDPHQPQALPGSQPASSAISWWLQQPHSQGVEAVLTFLAR